MSSEMRSIEASALRSTPTLATRAMSTPAWPMPPKLDGLDPGIRPTDFYVLVVKDEAPEQTKGGVFLPENQRDRESWAATRARLVAVSPLAFDFAKVDGESWRDHPLRPRVGDVVQVPKGVGTMVYGRDGRKYHLLTDREIEGVIEEVAS